MLTISHTGIQVQADMATLVPLGSAGLPIPLVVACPSHDKRCELCINISMGNPVEVPGCA
eukprot:CAMPEP_0119101452 /NCGR_PEP_ID=MMETSP1180-20130426/495_1 /TAXON_ID=3052 ORGANISM="Chlamydomonas cf sp, Strain CCMP681" /NCGR_SAMPLE_ID=MMETSP1180 /ASSEMBLY_ACC=CAM_ASM_000741 /LENGTH=59 /DNA_ID=CAMNT_0007085575 /DNA_START=707 /DNA_END=886 /DNA_ORIENTATION=-